MENVTKYTDSYGEEVAEVKFENGEMSEVKFPSGIISGLKEVFDKSDSIVKDLMKK